MHTEEQEKHASIEKDLLLKEMWNQMDHTLHASTEKSYENLLQSLYTREKTQLKRTIIRYTAGIAALVLLLVIPTFMYLYNPQPVELIYFQVSAGEIREIVLPDSSRIQVNAGSLLIYPEKFTGSKREVFLNGEANFFVEQNKKQPFLVHTQNFDIEVLGTTFHVNSFSHKTFTSTTLKSGKVRVFFHDDINSPFELAPGEQIFYYRAESLVKKEQANTIELFDWFNGHLIFKSLPLRDVTEILENKFNTKIYITSAAIENSVLTVKFKNNETLEEILETIQLLVPGIHYTIKEDMILITD